MSKLTTNFDGCNPSNMICFQQGLPGTGVISFQQFSCLTPYAGLLIKSHPTPSVALLKTYHV
eukprot:6462327-Pyramimonas_sp.AAC.1